MERGKVIFLGVIGLVIVLTVIYVISLNSGGSNNQVASDFSVPEIVDKEKTKDEYLSRLKNANTYQEEEVEEDLSEKMKFQTYQADSLKRIKTQKQTKSSYTASETRQYQTETKTRTTRTTARVEETKTKEPETTIVQVSEPVSNNMSVLVNQESSTPSKQNVTIKEEVSTVPNAEEDFIPIVLEEDSKIKEGSTVVFIAKSDFYIENQKISKNSYIYCNTSNGNERFILRATKILTYEGKTFRPTNYFVYDEKYTMGLQVEGTVNTAVKEATGETARDNNIDSYSGNMGIDASISLLKKTISKAGKSEPTINLYKGYKVYLKKE